MIRGNEGSILAVSGSTNVIGNLRRLLDESARVASGNPTTRRRIANPLPSARVIADGIGLACCIPGDKFDSVAEDGSLFSQIELIRRGKVDAPNPANRSTESILGTANDVFTYAGPCRYRKPRWPSGVGLIFRWHTEEDRSDEAVATPFDSGAVFDRLRPNDPEREQIDFVRRHELPVPGYRQLLQQYLSAFFADPIDYIQGTDPEPVWPISIAGGDARRWTFEVHFRERLSVNHQLAAVFVPKKIAGKSPRTMAQIGRWRSMGVDVRAYDSTVGFDLEQLETLTARYLVEDLRL